MKIIDHLITDFNKLTLEEEEENTGKQKEQISNTTQDNDIDVLQWILGDDLNEKDTTSINDKKLNNSAETLSKIQHSNEAENANIVSSTVSSPNQEVESTQRRRNIAQQQIKSQIHNTKKLRKEDQLIDSITDTIHKNAKEKSSSTTINIDSHKESITIKDQAHTSVKRCKLTKQEFNNQVEATNWKIRNEYRYTVN